MKKTLFEKLRRPDSNRSLLSYIGFAIIFGMIIVTFVFMSPGGTGNSLNGSGTAATVGGRVIPMMLFQQRVKSIEDRNKMFMQTGSEAFSRFFQQQALNELINSEVLSEIQMEEGLIVPDTQLANYIMEAPVFQEEGQFKRFKYENFLTNTGRSADALEEEIKKDLRMNLVRELFNNSFKSLDVETKVAQTIKDIKLKIDYLTISDAYLLNKVAADQSVVDAFLSDSENLKAAKKEYENTSLQYRENETVKSRILLVNAKDLNSPASMDEAKEKLMKLSEDLNPKNFIALVKKESDDPTASEGGDVGYVEKGTFTKEWDEAAFNTPVGEISKPFQTEVGWARLLVEEKKPAQTKSFEDVKSVVAQKVIQKNKVQEIKDKVQEFLKAKDTTALNSYLNAMGLKWEQTSQFGMSDETIPEIGPSDIVLEKVLSLKKDGDIYPEVIAVQGKNYLVRRSNIEFVDEAKEDQAPGMQGQRWNGVLGSWFDLKREDVSIKVNPSLEQNTPKSGLF